MIINDNLSEDEKIVVDRGFFFGKGLFETMLVKNNNILFLKEHMERINEGLKIIGIDKKVEPKEIIDSLKKLSFTDGVLKLVVSEKNTVFTCRKNNYTEDMYNKGFKLKISELKRNKYSTITYLKSLNYLDNILEHDKCKREGYDEVLFLNTDNEITEGSVSNIFFIKNNIIYTPRVECGLLNGTIRKYILKKYNVIEGSFRREQLMEADEIFVTNSIMGIMPVSKIEDKVFKEKDMVYSIINDYREYVSSS
ncbi:aminotransferase class IV [Clostridium sp.]|jgi:4-amino-4-deoxychorismate lyase|uniref:aminotransferase class IV n=1 Tax=Clostridium sp. TaxID=1506 RepID=UPI002589166E|nr:aminotransferase class IV [Clostridium sp.]MDF2504032.1 branched-chain amino acid aminotransferase/4-amino-4-deoxychorismate lyase [Clostridium sp.]